MIVKFFSRGRGDCSATMNYLLGKDRNREHAKILQGNPELTERLADNLEFKNRYTVGVLSFQENDLDDTAKREIMASFEQSLLAGLDQDQYDITWIEHKDKGRLELNFVIPNVELTTGKRLQPYYDRIDRPLVENWKQVINHDYGLSDPNDPRKAQAIKIDPYRLPESVQAIKETIGRVIYQQIEKGAVTSRTGVLELLEQSGFEIACTTEKSISVKNPNGKRNIRLEGFVYENRRFSGELGAERTRARQDYDRENTDRYRTALSKLQRAIAIKSESNTKYYQRPPSELTPRITPFGYQKDRHRGNTRGNGGLSARIEPSQSLALQEIPRNSRTTGTDRTEHQTDPSTSQSPNKSSDWTEQRRFNLDTAQKPTKNRHWQKQRRQAPNYLEITNHAKRLYERLQRLTGRAGDAIRRAYHAYGNPSRPNQAISNAERAITSHFGTLDERKQEILICLTENEQREQQVKQREQQVNRFIAEPQKALDRGRTL